MYSITVQYFKNTMCVEVVRCSVVQCRRVALGAACHYYARFLTLLLPVRGAGSAWRLITGVGTPGTATSDRALWHQVGPAWKRGGKGKQCSVVLGSAVWLSENIGFRLTPESPGVLSLAPSWRRCGGVCVL